MVRSRWIKAVMATLVSTGMAWSQSAVPSSPRPADDPTGRIITVHEAGKPAQRCRVVKWWVDDKGNKVWQVEALDTHEMMTILAVSAPIVGEPPTEGRLKALRTTIFHWRDRTPPPGTPMPPTAVCDAGCSSATPVASGGSRIPVLTVVPSVSGPVCSSCAPSCGNTGIASCDSCQPSGGGVPIITSVPSGSGTTCPTCTPSGSNTGIASGTGWGHSGTTSCDTCNPSGGSKSVASGSWGGPGSSSMSGGPTSSGAGSSSGPPWGGNSIGRSDCRRGIISASGRWA